MTTRFNPVLFDELIAHGASSFTAADVPDMQDKHENRQYWVTHLFLNSVVRGRYRSPLDAYVTAYLRRVEGSFVAHNLARDATIELLSQQQLTPSHYSRALLHWETFLGQAAQAQNVLVRLARELSGDDKYKLYERGDGSVVQRLHSVYNSLKHVEKRINAGQVPENSVSPVWFTDDGLQSTDATLTWTETGEVLDDLADWANGLQDPPGLADWLRAREDEGALDA